jgi:predicted N-formylglutamate amidohydrolase
VNLVLTCEHASARVPRRWRAVLPSGAPVLRTHRAFDPGARATARALATALDAPLVEADATRLLVDPNRGARHPRVFSEFTRALPTEQRAALLAELHERHWQAVRRVLDRAAGRAGAVLHVGVHSFTPALDGAVRDFDVGLLYDPRRPREVAVCAAGVRALRAAGFRARRNAPYRGDSDGLTTWMRRERAEPRYLGVELELNQALWQGARHTRARLVEVLVAWLAEATGVVNRRRA